MAGRGQKLIIKEAIISEKAGKMFISFQVRHSIMLKFMNWCEKNDVDAEIFLKKYFNLNSQNLPLL